MVICVYVNVRVEKVQDGEWPRLLPAMFFFGWLLIYVRQKIIQKQCNQGFVQLFLLLHISVEFLHTCIHTCQKHQKECNSAEVILQ